MSPSLERFLFAPCAGHRTAACRVLFGLYLFAYFGSMLPHVPLMFSNQGIYQPYLVPDYAPGPALAWLLFLAMLALCCAFVVGYRSEGCARGLFVLFLYHYFLQLAVKQSSFDRLIAIDLLVFCFADSGRAWGFDARRPGLAPCVWPERMLALQSVALYLGSGLWKLANPAWHTGALLRSTLQGMFATPLAFALVRAGFSDDTWTLFSFATIAFELALGPLLLIPSTRPLGIALGLGFHLFNSGVLAVPEFLVAACAYPVFVAPETLAALGERCVSWSAAFRRALLRP